jgi:hypothetical protein
MSQPETIRFHWDDDPEGADLRRVDPNFEGRLTQCDCVGCAVNEWGFAGEAPIPIYEDPRCGTRICGRCLARFEGDAS